MPSNDTLKNLIDLAIEEDLGCGDITTNTVVPAKLKAEAVIIAKEPCVVAGIYVAKQVFKSLDKSIDFKILAEDGESIKKGKIVARIKGRARPILNAERVSLNFLSHLSGIATSTNYCVKRIKASKTKILDSRKTLPGLRLLEKYAVRMGGGYNHRSCLDEQILIKDNHLKFVKAKCACRLALRKNRLVEIEVNNLKEFRSVICGPAHVIMLDNMKISDIRKAVALRDRLNRKMLLEVSGGVTLENLKNIARTGVDFISVGAITHSSKSIDFSLDIKNRKRRQG